MGQYKDWAKCLDCGERRMVRKREWVSASGARCLACGGPLEPSADATDDLKRHQTGKRESQYLHDKKTNTDRPKKKLK